LLSATDEFMALFYHQRCEREDMGRTKQ